MTKTQQNGPEPTILGPIWDRTLSDGQTRTYPHHLPQSSKDPLFLCHMANTRWFELFLFVGSMLFRIIQQRWRYVPAACLIQ